MSNRICWLGNFYELGFYDMPLCFSEARFKINSISAASSLDDFLKEWVSPVMCFDAHLF